MAVENGTLMLSANAVPVRSRKFGRPDALSALSHLNMDCSREYIV